MEGNRLSDLSQVTQQVGGSPVKIPALLNPCLPSYLLEHAVLHK